MIQLIREQERLDRVIVSLRYKELVRLVIQALGYQETVPLDSEMTLKSPPSAMPQDRWEIVFEWKTNEEETK